MTRTSLGKRRAVRPASIRTLHRALQCGGRVDLHRAVLRIALYRIAFGRQVCRVPPDNAAAPLATAHLAHLVSHPECLVCVRPRVLQALIGVKRRRPCFFSLHHGYCTGVPASNVGSRSAQSKRVVSRLASHLAISKLPTLGAAQLTWSWRGQRYLDGKASDSTRKDGLCSRQGAARRSLPAPSAWPPTSCSRLWAQTAAPSNGRSTPPSLRCLHRLLRSPCRMSRTSAS